VVATVPVCHIASGSRAFQKRWQIEGWGNSYTQNIISCMVRWKSPNVSVLGVLLPGCPAGKVLIHITLRLLPFDNSVHFKSYIQHPVNSFCMFCSVPYQLFGNPCVSLYNIYFSTKSWSIVQILAQVSVRCLHYPICTTIDCSCSVDVHFHKGVMEMHQQLP